MSLMVIPTRSADESQRPMVTEVLDDAKRLKLTVLRCWAFCDGAEEWNALQPELGKFSDKVFAGLDWLIVEAGRRGIRLLLSLTNYWADYGGMPAYVRWKYGIKDKKQHDYTKYPTSLFYTDPDMRVNFRRAVSAVVGRVNSLSGVPYAQDPTILGWELANEPRCPEGAHPGEGDRVLQEWVASTADFVRGLDRNHLITLGTEGFYGPSSPDMLSYNPFESASRLGADWVALGRSVDMVCIHLYPDSWMPHDSSREDIRRWTRNWIRSHAALCGGVPLLKPLVVSEFGKREPGRYTGPDCTKNMGREEAFKEILGSCREMAEGGGPLAGVCAWMTAARQYPDYDGFTLHLGPPEAPDRGRAAAPAGPLTSPQSDEPAVQLLQEYGQAMAKLSPLQPAAA
ncbi:hypothetical protein PLESTF_000321400 [Pleodorina starrii]|nr:hypothetical protein PLESTF_000321400 [Pleodorina starrii]